MKGCSGMETIPLPLDALVEIGEGDMETIPLPLDALVEIGEGDIWVGETVAEPETD